MDWCATAPRRRRALCPAGDSPPALDSDGTRRDSQGPYGLTRRELLRKCHPYDPPGDGAGTGVIHVRPPRPTGRTKHFDGKYL